MFLSVRQDSLSCSGNGSLTFEQLQTRHFRQFLLITFQLCQHSDTLTDHTEGQSHLVELVLDGKTTPRASLTRSSSFRIKCGDDGFRHVSFDVSHQSSTGDLHRARTKVPRVSQHWRQFRQHDIGSQQVVFSGRYPTAAVAMNSPSASRFSSSHAQADMRAWKRMQAVSSNRGVRCGAEVTYAGRNGTGKLQFGHTVHYSCEVGHTIEKGVLDARAIADSSYSAVSHHLPQVSRHQHPHSDTLTNHH